MKKKLYIHAALSMLIALAAMSDKTETINVSWHILLRNVP